MPSTRRHLGVAAALLAAPASALASGLDAPPGVGSLLSGPLSRDPAAVHHNPGQLGFLQKPTLLVGAGLVLGQVTVERERKGAYQSEETLNFKTPIPPEDLDPSKTGKASASEATPVGPAGDLFFSTGLGKSGLTLAAGAYAPYAAIVGYPNGGAQRFAMQEAEIIIAHFTGSAGLKVNKHFGLGAGVSYVLGTAEIRKLQDFGALQDFGDALARPPVAQPNDFGPDAPTEVRELDVLARPVHIHDMRAHGVTFNAGLAIHPTDELDLALTYQHGADLSFDGDFDLDLNDDFFTGDLAHVGLLFAPYVEGDANLRFTLPKRFGGAAGYDLNDDLHLEGRLQYVTWSDLDALRIHLESPGLAQPALGLPPSSDVALPRDWNDTVSLLVAARYQLRPGTHLLGQLGYDSPASPDATIDAASPDGHRLGLGLGAAFALTADIGLIGETRLQAVLPRDVSGSAHDLGNGRYSLLLAVLAAHLQVKW